MRSSLSENYAMQTPAQQLNLWKKQLGSVPDWVWDRTDLETLVLADNDLREVSDLIGRLKRLRMLDLGHNRLARVPATLGDLDGLTDFLYLHDKQLTSLPEAIGSCLELRQIDLRANPLTHLPASIAQLPRLEKLDLRWVDLPPYPWFESLEARGCLIYR